MQRANGLSNLIFGWAITCPIYSDFTTDFDICGLSWVPSNRLLRNVAHINRHWWSTLSNYTCRSLCWRLSVQWRQSTKSIEFLSTVGPTVHFNMTDESTFDLIVIIIHEFHGDTNLKQNFTANNRVLGWQKIYDVFSRPLRYYLFLLFSPLPQSPRWLSDSHQKYISCWNLAELDHIQTTTVKKPKISTQSWSVSPCVVIFGISDKLVTCR